MVICFMAQKDVLKASYGSFVASKDFHPLIANRKDLALLFVSFVKFDDDSRVIDSPLLCLRGSLPRSL